MKTYLVLVTAPAEGDVADGLAKTLVEERLAACVNLVPGVSSTYRWQGQVVRDQEALLLIKTSEDRLDDLVRRVVELHSYSVPEVIAFPVEKGHLPYLDWVRAETRPQEGR